MLFLLVQLKPDCLEYIAPLVDKVYDALRVLLSVAIIGMFVYKKRRLKQWPFMLPVIGMQITIIISTLLHSGEIWRPAMHMVLIVVFCMFIQMMIDKNPCFCISAFLWALAILLTINLITIFMFPDGMYEYESAISTIRRTWFLGYDNRFVRFVFLAIMLVELRQIQYKNSPKKISRFFIYAIGATTILITAVGAGMMLMLFYILFRCFPLVSRREQLFNARNYLLFNAMVFIVLIVLNAKYPFIESLTNLVGKDATFTGRTLTWIHTIFFILQSPLIGYGFEDIFITRQKLGLSSAHNIYLSIQYMGGLLASVQFFILLIMVMTKLYHYKKVEVSKVLSFFFFLLLLYCQVESSYSLYTFSILLILYNVDRFVPLSHNVSVKQLRNLTISHQKSSL